MFLLSTFNTNSERGDSYADFFPRSLFLSLNKAEEMKQNRYQVSINQPLPQFLFWLFIWCQELLFELVYALASWMLSVSDYGKFTKTEN